MSAITTTPEGTFICRETGKTLDARNREDAERELQRRREAKRRAA